MAVKTTYHIPPAPAKPQQLTLPCSKILLEITNTATGAAGELKTFPAGTPYRLQLGKIQGFTCSIYVIDNRNWTDI